MGISIPLRFLRFNFTAAVVALVNEIDNLQLQIHLLNLLKTLFHYHGDQLKLVCNQDGSYALAAVVAAVVDNIDFELVVDVLLDAVAVAVVVYVAVLAVAAVDNSLKFLTWVL